MKVQLIARPQFVGQDVEEYERCRPDQMQGTDAEKVAEFAGRGCYDSYGKGRDSEAFAANILDHFHPNVLYHSTFVLWITGVSRNLSHELVRHHVGFSPSQRSTRFVNEAEAEVIFHPKVQSLLMDDSEYGFLLSAFDVAWRELYEATVKKLVDRGQNKKTAHGAAARILPNGIETRLTWSGNAAAFLSMIQRRSEPGIVDDEFVLLANEMLRILKAEMPMYFNHIPYTEIP